MTERKVCIYVWNCLIFFLIEYSSISPEICHVVSKILLILLHGIPTKFLSFGKKFQKFWALRGYPLSRFLKFDPSFSNFFQSSYYVEKFWKKFTHVLSYIFFLSSKDAHQKTKHKKCYDEEKLGRFDFGKTNFPIVFLLDLGLIMPYPLDVLIWNFY